MSFMFQLSCNTFQEMSGRGGNTRLRVLHITAQTFTRVLHITARILARISSFLARNLRQSRPCLGKAFVNPGGLAIGRRPSNSRAPTRLRAYVS